MYTFHAWLRFSFGLVLVHSPNMLQVLHRLLVNNTITDASEKTIMGKWVTYIHTELWYNHSKTENKNTVRCHYNAANCIKYIHNKHRMARP